MSNLIKYFNFLNNTFGFLGECYFCGGSVRDTLMDKTPKDYDFFILSSKTYTDCHVDITNKIVESNLKEVKSDLEFHKSEPFMITQIEIDGDLIQIMWSPRKDINDLLDSFDWNVSLFSYGQNGYENREKIENIGLNKELKLQKITFPKSSLRRGFRFSERFGMIINKEDFNKLIERIYIDNSKKNDMIISI